MKRIPPEKLKKMSHKEIEKAEEESGVDYDNDDEKGESEAHKRKMDRAKRFKEWLQEREAFT